jgi:ABC-type transport system substrate-binding protein
MAAGDARGGRAEGGDTMIRQRRHAFIAVAAAAALLVGACASDEEAQTDGGAEGAGQAEVPGVYLQGFDEDPGPPQDGGQLTWGLEAETDGWDPATSRWALSGHNVASAIFDPLVAVNADGEAEAYLAESLTPNEDFTEWIIKVRPGVTFHDGTPLDAAAITANLQAHQRSVITSAAVASIDTVETVDPSTVKVTMIEPWAPFPYILTSQVGYIIAPSQIGTSEASTNPIGTGPFEFSTWQKGEFLNVTKNPDYWQEGLPHLDAIEFEPIANSDELFNALLSGDIDMANTARIQDLDALRGKDIRLVEYAAGEEYFVLLNAQKPPFDNADARRAVAFATDQDRYLSETGRRPEQQARSPFAPGAMGFTEDDGYLSYDLAAAQESIAAYTAATGVPLSFSYQSPGDVESLRDAQTLETMWEEAGMQVEIATVKQEDQIVNTVLGTYEATSFRNFGPADPDPDLTWWHSRSISEDGISLNMPRYADPELDAALIRGRSTLDEATRQTAYEEVARRLNASAAYIWLERVTWGLAAQERVHGFEASQNGTIQTLGAKPWVADLWVD